MKTSKPTGASDMTVARIQKIAQRITVTPSCWLWGGAHTKKGYSESFSSKGVVYVHRLMFELVHGAIPQNMVVDHTCDNPGCVSPYHLRALSNAENIWRKYETQPKIHCQRGHLFEGNSITRTNSRNGRPRRWCVPCLKKQY